MLDQLSLFDDDYYSELHPAKYWRSFDSEILIFPEFLVNRKGQIYSTISNQFLKPSSNKYRGGYCQVALTNEKVKNEIQYKLKKHWKKRSHRKNFYIHKLVACTFITNVDRKKYNIVNHIDENPLNNYINNLEWCTAAENSRKYWKNKTINQLKMF